MQVPVAQSLSSVAARFSTPSAHLRVMWPRAIMTHNGAKHAVATARQLFFLTPARGVHSVQGKESWEMHV
jgi:hypothetical protein